MTAPGSRADDAETRKPETKDSETKDSKADDCQMDDCELDRRLAALTRDAEPAPANWTAIERRIRRRRLPALAAAAAGVAAIGFGIMLVARVDTNGFDEGAARSVVQAEVRAMEASAPEHAALRQLDTPEGLMEAWQDNRQAIDELNRALERDPDNQLLLEFLAQARLRQARLVRQGMTTTT